MVRLKDPEGTICLYGYPLPIGDVLDYDTLFADIRAERASNDRVAARRRERFPHLAGRLRGVGS